MDNKKMVNKKQNEKNKNQDNQNLKKLPKLCAQKKIYFPF